MAVDKETFMSNYRKDYKWPSFVPLVAKPAQPPVITKPANFYVVKLVEPFCHCDAHRYEPQMGRYKMLAEKERMLHKELECVGKEMTVLAGEVLDHPCDTYDDKMMTIYQADYNKKGLESKQYRKLMAAIDTRVGLPFDGPTITLRDGYRDPTAFRHYAIQRPRIDVCPPVTCRITPQSISDWFTPLIGRSEYQDTISKMGLSLLKSSQQYAEPLPSSRRRYGDMCM
ncbi:hypothetical protein Zmor_010469 [Zophobas morio]|uniref:Uncharacterized protein n=1 Tax=Zophobas morio TaxID=2755281 RepID=A0AA38MJZ6_9CUCU|nr:hypothetical protein Zmor_010469 [Zophobas morio]